MIDLGGCKDIKVGFVNFSVITSQKSAADM
jgi:hypothetical protein